MVLLWDFVMPLIYRSYLAEIDHRRQTLRVIGFCIILFPGQSLRCVEQSRGTSSPTALSQLPRIPLYDRAYILKLCSKRNPASLSCFCQTFGHSTEKSNY